MTRKFFPGCKVKNRYPEASRWLAEQVISRDYADEIVGCCRVEHQSLAPDDTALCICNNCMAMIDEDVDNGVLENIWMIIDQDDGFLLPDYGGRRMGVQDCGRAYDRIDVQDAVRSLLRKMNIEVVELPDARERCRFCGASFLGEAPAQDRGFAPWRYGEDAVARGIFMGMNPDDIHDALVAHCEAIEPNEVVCYCTACDAGLEEGGKDAINLLELISGKGRTRLRP